MTPDLSRVEPFARGVTRPEGITGGLDGSVWVSDKGSAAARVDADGTIHPTGRADGEPNSLNLLPDGRLLIANFEGHLQTLDPESGKVESFADSADGRPVIHSNYALADAAGFVWATESTQHPRPGPETIPEMLDEPDGWLFVRRPDGSTEILAEGLSFANGLAFSADGRHLFVAETFTGCISRAEIRPGGAIGPLEVFCQLPADGLEERYMAPGPDGMAFDEAGTLWIGVYNRNAIMTMDSDGTIETALADPESTVFGWPTNPVFVGPDRRTLLVGSITQPFVARTRVDMPGTPAPHTIVTPAAG